MNFNSGEFGYRPEGDIQMDQFWHGTLIKIFLSQENCFNFISNALVNLERAQRKGRPKGTPYCIKKEKL